MNYRKLLMPLLSLAAAVSSYGTVYFQNTGTTTGWDNVYTQQIGRIYQVTSPAWNSTGTAIAFEQTWNNVQTGYHSEAVKFTTQSNGQDRYYGKVIRFPSNWYVENTNYTFAQYSPEDPSGPWCLQFVQGNSFKIQDKANGGIADLGGASFGTWVRIVVRFKLSSSGIQEVWVNGTKKMSVSGNIQVPGTTARWSNGIYCTAWRTSNPPSQAWSRTIYQDQFRVASTYNEAEPNNWGNDGVTFYSSVNYSGTASQVLTKGSYTISDLAAKGITNDSASSVKIPSGWTVTIYQNDNFGGTSWIRTSDTPDFTSISGLNDAMSSCVIQ